MASVLVANAPNCPRTELSILIEPVDVLAIATWLRHHGHETVFADLDRHGVEELGKHRRGFDLAVLVLDYLIPLHTGAAVDALDPAIAALAEIADVVMLAGRPASYRPSELLERYSLLDGCILGEAEWPLLELCQGARSGPAVVFRHHGQQTSEIRRPRVPGNVYDQLPDDGPISDRRLCRTGDYIDVRSIISSRGCGSVCRFCSTVDYWGPWRGASPALMLAEMRRLSGAGAGKIIFLDDSFANDRRRVIEFCELLRRHPLPCAWGCLSRIEDLTAPTLTDMAEVGCRWIHFGIEHGNPGVRARLGKHFTDDLAASVIAFAISRGIRVRTSWLVDAPGWSADSLDETFRFAETLSSHEIKLHFLVTRPGSLLYRNRIRSLHRVNGGAALVGSLSIGEISIHSRGSTQFRSGGPTNDGVGDAVHRFRQRMADRGYQWVDDVAFWRRFDSKEANINDRFLSTVITRYGLGWH